jgi:hypothetical protein
MWNLDARFSKDEQLRYGAECRRLGRLARGPKAAAKQRQTTGWLSQLFSPPRRASARLAHR